MTEPIVTPPAEVVPPVVETPPVVPPVVQPVAPVVPPVVPVVEPEAKGAPEQYADFTLPEGVTLDAALSDSFKATSKELGLPQDKAQKLVDLYAKSTKAAIEGQLAEFAEQQKGWKEATLKALGANADKELAFAAKARDAFGSPELAKLLEETKLGDRIEIVQMLIKAGKAISEGGFVEGKGSGPESKSFADALYGKPAAK